MFFGKIGKKIRNLFGGKVDEAAIEELEQLFFEADLGAKTSEELTATVRKLYKKSPNITVEAILDEIKKELAASMQLPPPPSITTTTPHVILIIGANGNGKTTTIAKLAKRYASEGKKVLVAAADTFRAAATEQLEKWAESTQIELVKGKSGSDPAAVVFDAIQAAQSRGSDIVLIDTAGRLHTKTDLMQELQKIRRVSDKALPGAPHETILVLDATLGQNTLDQAQTFHEYTPLTGLILTKLDGTAKGGTAIAIQKKLSLPIHFIGTGEGIEDLQPFELTAFIQDLF
ncbi:MAG: Signal recognition particle receptor FtsY [Chlamydiae bacterium]|nr:Signal recognition particle receptor FtsY [Chlamydiota bacterium]